MATSMVSNSLMMSLFTEQWDLRSAWSSLPNQTKLFFFLLLVLAILSSVAHLRIVYSQTIKSKAATIHRVNAGRGFLRALENLRQLHTLLFLLFGLFLTDYVYRIVRSFQFSRMSLCSPTVSEMAAPCLAFAFASLLILIFLHCLHWFVCFRSKNQGDAL